MNLSLTYRLILMFQVKNLTISIEGKQILRDFCLSVKPGEIIALMGPNGSGKSSFAHAVAGHPGYKIESGQVWLEKKDLLAMEPEERAQAGLFLAFQYPASIPGVSVSHFLRLSLNAIEKARQFPITGVASFLGLLKTQMKALRIPWEFASRSVNDGFSGGEKKRLEMLQMLILKPKLVILDEIDSGLDIDAIKIVAAAVHRLDPKTGVIIITHYQRLLNHLTPDRVHILRGGKIIRSGNMQLVEELERMGYGDYKKETKLSAKK